MRRRVLGTDRPRYDERISFSCDAFILFFTLWRDGSEPPSDVLRDEDVDEATEIVAPETSRDGSTNLGARGRHAVREDV